MLTPTGGCTVCHCSMAHKSLRTTLVSPLRRDGTPHAQCAREDGAALRLARRRKERAYPELSGEHGGARLVVLACEVGGRWSSETQSFLRQLAKAKTRHVPHNLRTSAKLAWMWRWCTILACASARALALSLLERRSTPGHDGPKEKGKGGPGEGNSPRGRGGPNQTLKPTPTHETPLYHETRTHATQTTHNTTQQIKLVFAKVSFGQSRFWPKSVLAKVGFGQSRFWPKSVLAKVGLAKVGHDRSITPHCSQTIFHHPQSHVITETNIFVQPAFLLKPHRWA